MAAMRRTRSVRSASRYTRIQERPRGSSRPVNTRSSGGQRASIGVSTGASQRSRPSVNAGRAVTDRQPSASVTPGGSCASNCARASVEWSAARHCLIHGAADPNNGGAGPSATWNVTSSLPRERNRSPCHCCQESSSTCWAAPKTQLRSSSMRLAVCSVSAHGWSSGRRRTVTRTSPCRFPAAAGASPDPARFFADLARQALRVGRLVVPAAKLRVVFALVVVNRRRRRRATRKASGQQRDRRQPAICAPPHDGTILHPVVRPVGVVP